MHTDHDSDVQFRLPDGFRLDDVLCSDEATNACLSGWDGVGEDEPLSLTGQSDGWA
jgi:hypothetical protein